MDSWPDCDFCGDEFYPDPELDHAAWAALRRKRMAGTAAVVQLRNVKTPRALGCYVTLAKPRAMEVGKDPEYSVALLWPKSTDLTDLKRAIAEAAVSKWGSNAPRLIGTKLRNPLRDGDLKGMTGSPDDKPDEHYAGKWFVNARSKQRVSIVDTNLVPVDPNEVYSGMYFHASLRFYPYSQKGNSGVGCGLQNLMVVGRGKRIDGRETADQAFKDFTPDVMDGDEGGLDDLIGGPGNDNIPF
jgi:hypothetical protein